MDENLKKIKKLTESVVDSLREFNDHWIKNTSNLVMSEGELKVEADRLNFKNLFIHKSNYHMVINKLIDEKIIIESNDGFRFVNKTKETSRLIVLMAVLKHRGYLKHLSNDKICFASTKSFGLKVSRYYFGKELDKTLLNIKDEDYKWSDLISNFFFLPSNPDSL